jgi:hypothetical protein
MIRFQQEQQQQQRHYQWSLIGIGDNGNSSENTITSRN